MKYELGRRHLLTAGIVLFGTLPGCLAAPSGDGSDDSGDNSIDNGDNSDDTGDNSDDTGEHSPPEECYTGTRARTEAAGDAVGTTIHEVDEGWEDDLERYCQFVAVNHAIEVLAQRIDVTLADVDWIQRSSTTIVLLTSRSTDGAYWSCPKISLHTARQETPETVSVTVEYDDSEPYECTHQIWVSKNVEQDD